MRCKWRTLITDHEGERRAPPNSPPLTEPRAWTQRTAGARSVSFPGPARRRSTDELPTPSATPRPVCLVRRELQRRGLAEAGRRTCLTCGDLNPPPTVEQAPSSPPVPRELSSDAGRGHWAPARGPGASCAPAKPGFCLLLKTEGPRGQHATSAAFRTEGLALAGFHRLSRRELKALINFISFHVTSRREGTDRTPLPESR